MAKFKATFSRSSWGLLCHTQVGPSTLKIALNIEIYWSPSNRLAYKFLSGRTFALHRENKLCYCEIWQNKVERLGADVVLNTYITTLKKVIRRNG